jgi:hypothetical protein
MWIAMTVDQAMNGTAASSTNTASWYARLEQTQISDAEWGHGLIVFLPSDEQRADIDLRAS